MKKIKQPQTGEGEKPRGASECQEHSLPPAAREASGTGMCMSTSLAIRHIKLTRTCCGFFYEKNKTTANRRG